MKWNLGWGILLLMVGLSCSEPGKISMQNLEGPWVLSEALREGKTTLALQGAYFVFEGNAVETNFPVQGLENRFELSANSLYIYGNPPLEFTIESYDGKDLLLTTEIQGISFSLVFNKKLD
jgi:hypothetical protein